MKVFIIEAQSADGFIARDHSAPSTAWTSKEDKEFFREHTKRAGVMIMGATTYKTIGRPMKDRVTIVYSRSETYEGVEMTQDDPKTLIDKLSARGFTEVAICGGSSIYSMFLEAGVVDTIYLTVEPVLFGSGVSPFKDSTDTKLELVSESKTESGTLFLEYKVLSTIS
nr:Dihydrofolate reductase [uncultured bacterium]AIA16458.1 Dihydrofolate reductase [uncultured bacterium]